MKTNDVYIYSLKEAVTNAIDMSIKYNKDYAVVQMDNGYGVISARYANYNKDKLTIEYITDIKNAIYYRK